jgi:glutaredoxin
MKLFLTYFLLGLTAGDISLELLALIAKAKAERTPAVVVEPVIQQPPIPPTVASHEVKWKPYWEAQSDYRIDGKLLVIVFGFEGCGPCKTLKAAIEKERIGGVHYAYVDVVNEPTTAAILGVNPPITVPQVMLYWESGEYKNRSISSQHFTAGNASPSRILEAIRAAKGEKPAAKAAQTKASYSWRVERIAKPVGFGVAYVGDGDYYRHVTEDHAAELSEILRRVNIRGMSNNDLFALHSLLRKQMPIGKWEGNVFVFQLPSVDLGTQQPTGRRRLFR